MAVWETDDEYMTGPAATSLPTPQDTPYRTPSTASRKSRRSITPPQERGDKRRASKDMATDEGISILDPRRFTPTLHANLVAEILALRRDQEDKIKLIEGLEADLHSAKEQHESLQENLVDTTKETRSLKRQLNLLEGGTSSALGELVKERDTAVESVTDARKRLEAAQKKIRNQEDDSQRVHELWAKEKDDWEEERRKFERKLHVAESRLKVVLDEVAAYQSTQPNHGGANGHESEVEESGRENDAASVRTMSMTNSIRFSVVSGMGVAKPNGNSLADELNWDTEDDQTDADGRESALSNYTTQRHARNMSRDSVYGRMHRRNQSMESPKRTGSIARGRLFMNPSVLETLEGEDEETQVPEKPKVSYTDTGIQYSPPPSPKLPPSKPATPEPSFQRSKSPDFEGSPRGDGEIEANQRRKRVHITRPKSFEPPPPRKLMVSTSSQTMEMPMTPPKTPKSPTRPPPPPPMEVKPPPPVMVTTSTQTDLPPPLRTLAPPPLPSPPLAVPSINIQPPTSRPTTPREPRLPQYFKHFGCQVNLSTSVSTSEVAVQTEGIQTDKRLALLPPHLQPSSITSRPNSPNPAVVEETNQSFTPLPGNVPPRNPRRLTSQRSSVTDIPSSPISLGEDSFHDHYPGNNDDGPLSSQKAPIRRPHRFSSLFAGFDVASSDEGDEFGDVESDSEYRTALSAPKPKAPTTRSTKRSSTGTTSTNATMPASPEHVTMRQVPRGVMRPFSGELHNPMLVNEKEPFGRRTSVRSGRAFEKSPAIVGSGRVGVMRKAAMIQSGIASHQGRSRSPSIPDPKNPPFPIPTRASSRKVPTSSSAPSDGQRSPTRGNGFPRRGMGRHYRAGSIRKVRSAAALPHNQRSRRQGSRSPPPPPMSPSTEAPESPGLPPLPRNDITTPRTRVRTSGHFRHRHQLSNNTNITAPSDPLSLSSASQSTGVVDAIAQTMVGEWMFKYVRRRKSFGVPEGNGKDDSSNDRHKRWVWLAPYERAILWSSKQPSSGSALMGKTGRKLTIQSVLDVKDDNAAPKGVAGPLFNRSILILTPQRALKFTATSADRHYIWLTALSFLAHSPQAVPEIVAPLPPPVQPAPLPEFEAPQTKLKRGGIRDSIRLAKGRTAIAKPGPPSVPSIPSIPSVPSSQLGDVAIPRLTESIGGFSSNHSRDNSREAAEAPYIPRFHDRNPAAMVHGRKRSNTGGHVPPPLSFRGFSGPIGGVSNHNYTNSTAGSSDIFQSQTSNTTWGMSQTGSRRTSEASSRPGNFFDAIGTVRMEAFISPLAFSQFNDYPDEQDEFRQIVRRRSKELRRRQSRSRHRDSYGRGYRGRDDESYGNKNSIDNDYFREDPFKGF